MGKGSNNSKDKIKTESKVGNDNKRDIATRSKNSIIKAPSSKRLKVCTGILAAVFALFIIFGESYDDNQSWYFVFGSKTNFAFAAVQFTFWLLVFYLSLSWLFTKLDSILLQDKTDKKSKHSESFSDRHPKIARPINWYLNKCQQHSFITPFITLLIVSLPFCIMSYPGIFMGDSAWIIHQSLGTTPLNELHPPTYTFINGLFLSLRSTLGWNLSLFMLSLLQMTTLCAATSYAISIVIKKSGKKVLIAILMCYYIIHPILYQVVAFHTKDIFLTSCYVVFVPLFYQIFLERPSKSFAVKISLGLTAIGIVLFRSESIYILSCVFLAALLIKGARLQSLLYLLTIVAIIGIERLVIFPWLHVQPSSISEMLSVPFQQTARYVRDYPDEVTANEKHIISSVLDYENLGNDYNKNYRSDTIKYKYHGNNDQLRKYFGVWFSMFLKHPGVYIQSVTDSYYQYFFFSPKSKIYGEARIQYGKDVWVQKINHDAESSFDYPKQTSFVGITYQKIRDKMNQFPLLDIFTQPALYTWTLFIMIAYCVYRKSYRGFVFLTIGIMQVAFFILGPTNGYYGRYQLPMMVYLPIMVAFLMLLLRSEANKSTR